MKYFILGLLISFQSQAVNFSKYRSTPDGVASQKFILEEKSATLEKTSNYFDMKPKDYGIGILKLQTLTNEYRAEMKKVEALAEKLKKVDDYLKTKDSSYNEVSGPVTHEVIIMVNDYRIKPASKYYTELDGIFKKLQSLDWKLTKGYRITEDLEKVMEIDNGKTVKTSPYSRVFYCRSAQLPTQCTFQGGGQIFVE